ncbi:MAG: hypothetical protein CVU91_12390 [Firmicutes bacterium HGW-Firmicutes-16]|nr:MAG: hypothetical protein CVU91_12390 [Firmicutes bacterium HGW-Firmicutes-16]
MILWQTRSTLMDISQVVTSEAWYADAGPGGGGIFCLEIAIKEVKDKLEFQKICIQYALHFKHIVK